MLHSNGRKWCAKRRSSSFFLISAIPRRLTRHPAHSKTKKKREFPSFDVGAQLSASQYLSACYLFVHRRRSSPPPFERHFHPAGSDWIGNLCSSALPLTLFIYIYIRAQLIFFSQGYIRSSPEEKSSTDLLLYFMWAFYLILVRGGPGAGSSISAKSNQVKKEKEGGSYTSSAIK